MRRELVLTPKFKRAFRRFVRRDARLQERIEDALMLMQEDVFAPSLGTHKLSGTLEGLPKMSLLHGRERWVSAHASTPPYILVVAAFGAITTNLSSSIGRHLATLGLRQA